MTLQRRPTESGDDPDRLIVEFSRLLCDDGPSASCRSGCCIEHEARVFPSYLDDPRSAVDLGTPGVACGCRQTDTITAVVVPWAAECLCL